MPLLLSHLQRKPGAVGGEGSGGAGEEEEGSEVGEVVGEATEGGEEATEGRVEGSNFLLLCKTHSAGQLQCLLPSLSYHMLGERELSFYKHTLQVTIIIDV